MKKSIGIILMVLLFLSMATGLGIAIGALVASSEVEENNPYIKDGNWWIGDVDTGIPATGDAPTIEISEDGYWVINGVKTEYKANGENGEAPTIEISEDGYWVINGIKTNVKAQGSDGVTGGDGHTPEITISDTGTWVIDGVDTGIVAEGHDGSSLDFKVEESWLYIKKGNGEYEPIWNFEYGVNNAEDCAEAVVNSKVEELQQLLKEEQSDAVKKVINDAIAEVGATDLTDIDTVAEVDALIEELNEAIEDVKIKIADQESKEVTVVIILGSEVVTEYIALKGSVVEEPACSEKAGYTLKWYCEGQEYDFATVINKDVVIEGVYEANTYSIKYFVDGNELDETSEYKFGEDAVVDVQEPEKEGYKFNGWVDANNVAYETKPMPIYGITLYASWVANSYVVDYDLNYVTTDLKDLDVVYGEAYELAQPERQGYKFIGWYLNDELVENQGDAWSVAKNVTLVAKWEGFKLNASVEGNVVTLNVTAIDTLQIEKANTIEVIIKVKTSEVEALTGKSLIADSKELSVKSSVDGDYTVYVVTFYAEAELTVENNVFAELTVTLASGVTSATLNVTEVTVNGSGEYLGTYDVEYKDSIVIEGNL